MFYFPCSPEHKIFLLLTGLNNEDTNIFWDGELKTDKISQQPENCENRNDPDLVQAFLKKWWVESDFKAPNFPLSLRFKGSGSRETVLFVCMFFRVILDMTICESRKISIN
jgi:hypothetical protein